MTPDDLTSRKPQWVDVACFVADVIRHSDHVTVYASHTDLSGEHGAPEVYTEWGIKALPDGRERPVLREWRFPSALADGPDRLPCRHAVPTREWVSHE